MVSSEKTFGGKLGKETSMTREKLIADIKKCVPHVVAIVGDDFNWEKAADVIDGKIKICESANQSEEDFEIMCVCMTYANRRNLSGEQR